MKAGLLAMFFLIAGLCGTRAQLVQGVGLWAIDGDTFVVEMAGERAEIRVMGVDSLELEGCLGKQAMDFVQGLITRPLWLELDPEMGRARRDRNGRLLAHVFLSPERTPGSSLAVALAEEGFARLDVRDPKDIWDEDHFDIRYAPWVIRAQIAAARERKGWWGRCDPFAAADLVIAAVKQWGNDEVVYVLNRGDAPVDLAAGWALTSEPSQALDFGHYVRELVLPPGWILRVHTGPLATGRNGQSIVDRTEMAIDWYWTGRKVWRQEGDVARLILGETVMYEYRYPASGED